MTAGGTTTRADRRPRARFVGPLLIVAAFVLGFVIAGVGVGLITSGLGHTLATADGPGVIEIDASRGEYVLTRATSDRPVDAGPLGVSAVDPSVALVTPHAPGSYIEVGGVRYDLLADIELTSRGPAEIEVTGDVDHFPVTVRRDQVAWVRFAGVVTAAAAVLPLGLFVAGVAMIVRDKHRQTKALVDFVAGVQ